jgi:hypothetical protein
LHPYDFEFNFWRHIKKIGPPSGFDSFRFKATRGSREWSPIYVNDILPF